MWASIPRQAREFIYDHDLPMKIAHVDADLDLPEREIRVAGIAQRDDSMLFVRSSKDKRDWEFPGGRLDEGESPTEAVQREFTEETGLSVSEAEPLLALVWAFHDSTIVQIVFCVEADGMLDPADDDEVCDIGWFNSFPDPISFGEAGQRTYEVIVNSEPMTVAFSDDTPSDTSRVGVFSNRRTLAVGGVVAGGAVVAGLARRLNSEE